MATIATAEVQVIADTSRFVPDLRRKLRAAFASLGNQLGDDIVQRIDRRISQRLTTVMNQAARRAGTTFTQAFNQALGQAGLSTALRDQLGGAGSRRGARQAGEAVAEAFGEAFEGTAARFSDDFFRDLGNQAAFRAAGRAGADTAQSFTDSFRNGLQGRLGDQIRDEFTEAVADLDRLTEIPAIFRRIGDNAGTSFVQGAESRIDDLNDALFNAFAANPEIDSDAFFAGQRGGIAYSDGLFESLNERLAREMREAIEEATNTGIPPIFRRMGNTSATEFVDEFTEEIDNSLTATLGRAFQRLGEREAEDAGGRAGTRFGRAFTNALRSLPGLIGNLLSTILVRPLSGLGNIFAEMSSELLSMAGQMLAVVALLEALSGLLFGMPAALNVAAAAIAAIIVPLLGVQDAFSEAFGEAENFEDALEGLTTPAQDVARELRAIAPALNEMRLGAQAAFFSEIDGVITEIADNLTNNLTTGLESASGAFGRIVDQIGEFLAQAETADTVAAVFESLTGIFDALAESTVPFLEGMRTLVDEFLPRISNLEDALSQVGDEFRNWTQDITESGEAMEAFDRGIDTLEEIASIALDISAIFDAMFDAAESEGIDALGAIGDAIADVRAEFESLEGQEALGTFFDSLGRIAGVLGGVISALVDNFAELSPEIAELAEEVGPPLEDFINEITDGFKELLDSGGEEFFREVVDTLSEVDWETIGEQIGEFLGQVSTLLDDVGTGLNAIINIATFVINLLHTLNDLFSGTQSNEWTKNIQDFFDELLNLPEANEWIDEFDADMQAFFTEDLPATVRLGFELIVDEITGWVTVIKETLKGLWEDLGFDAEAAFASLGGIILGQLGLTTADIEGWQTELDLSWVTFWTSLPTKAAEQLDNLIQGVSTRLSLVRDIVTGWAVGVAAQWRTFWNGLSSTATSILIGIAAAVSSRLATIRSTVSGWVSGVRALWTVFWSGLTSAVSSGLSAVQTRVATAVNGVRNAFSGMVNSVRNILSGLVGFLSNIASQISNIVGRISSAVSGAVSAASSLSGIDLNPFANGGIVYGPTPALVGDAGREVIIPLTRPQRAVELVNQSGLMGLLAAQGALGSTAGVTSGPSPEIHVHSALADPEQIARRAVRILERQSARGLARTGG